MDVLKEIIAGRKDWAAYSSRINEMNRYNSFREEPELHARLLAGEAEFGTLETRVNAVKAELSAVKAEQSAAEAEQRAAEAKLNAAKAECDAEIAQLNATKAKLAASLAEIDRLRSRPVRP